MDDTQPAIPRLTTAADAEALKAKIIDAVERQIAPSEVDLEDFSCELTAILGLVSP